jgi:Protein of unknown function (DUF2442)
MKSENIGSGTSAAEILNVSPHGFWLMAGDREYFLSAENFPWFRGVTLKQLFNVELHHGDHFYWPEIDVDLDIERITHPERFPLVAKVGG